MQRVFRMAALVLAGVGASAGSSAGLAGSGCAAGEEVSPVSVPACAMTFRKGEQYVLPQYLKGSEFDAHGLTWLRLNPGGYVYVNRNGRIVVRDVSMMDNGADAFHHGVVRLEHGGKYGFADWNGRVVVPIRYEGASNTDDGGPRVCTGCRIEPSGEYSAFVGGQWFSVDARFQLHAAPGP